MKPRIVLPRRVERRVSFLYGPPFPGESGWVWIDRRAQLERRSRHSGIERRARLREEEFFRTLFEIAPEAAVVLDIRGAVVLANRQCESLLGCRRAELLGESVEPLLAESYRVPYLNWRDRYAAEPSPTRLEVAIRRRDGFEVPVEISLNPVESMQRQLLFVAVRDITGQRRAMAALERELQALAEAKARLEADYLALANRAR